MNSPRGGLRVAALISALISLGHIVRLWTRGHVQIGTFAVPQWPSVVAVVVFGFLAIWLWRLSAKAAA